MAPDLRLIVITDRRLAAPRDPLDIARRALDAGAPAVQLRDKDATARELLHQARALRTLTRERGALLFINDRLDVALAAAADGVHLGPDDIPVDAARRAVHRGFLIGASTDDPDDARRLAHAGADYIGCGAVFGTTSKPGLEHEAIGPDRLAAVAAAVCIPVVAIGGITPDNVSKLAGSGAAGVAVISAIMAADDPVTVTNALLAAFHR